MLAILHASNGSLSITQYTFNENFFHQEVLCGGIIEMITVKSNVIKAIITHSNTKLHPGILALDLKTLTQIENEVAIASFLAVFFIL